METISSYHFNAANFGPINLAEYMHDPMDHLGSDVSTILLTFKMTHISAQFTLYRNSCRISVHAFAPNKEVLNEHASNLLVSIGNFKHNANCLRVRDTLLGMGEYKRGVA